MVVDDPFCVAHAAVANLDGVAVKYFSKFVVFMEVFVYYRERNLCPMLVLTFLLNGGLYRIMLFRGLFLRLVFVEGS